MAEALQLFVEVLTAKIVVELHKTQPISNQSYIRTQTVVLADELQVTV
ncbi:MAG: hypothetical protein HYZ44_14460 [Bacteroidetes bacterium]|nr:hypothetical protein [Bacteroidota bacterium]